ncbi:MULTISPECIES: hypothetical protein [Streptomyces]|uniref:Uncharacterized protein n=1 Tax=Streptomyces glycanivorans TaxID=3033808 RepID=A0ABY9JD06_9ACTN|nr:hypothetical protein [Streptomyces sp. Alt3]WLQ64556.1 hypothetical protein P8A20_13565 [Streptomyces sp. Alt3]
MTSGSRSTPSTLLHRFDRNFRVWQYGVGHSHLLLRSRKDGVEDTRLDLHFEAVESMRLVTSYEGLELHTVTDSEFSRVYEESGVPQRWRDTRLVVRLRSRGGATGHVQCARVIADRHQDDEGVSAIRDVVWSLRPSGLRVPGTHSGDAQDRLPD